MQRPAWRWPAERQGLQEEQHAVKCEAVHIHAHGLGLRAVTAHNLGRRERGQGGGGQVRVWGGE